jgi:hypothetical protein
MGLALAGHSSHVTCVRWLEEDTHLISVGGNDKCIFQWKATWGNEDADARAAAVELDTDDEVELKRDGATIDRSAQHTAATSLDFDSAFQMEVRCRLSSLLCRWQILRGPPYLQHALPQSFVDADSGCGALLFMCLGQMTTVVVPFSHRLRSRRAVAATSSWR